MNNSTRTVKEVLLNIFGIQKVTILLFIAALLFITYGCGSEKPTEVSHNNDANNPPPIATGSVTLSWDKPTTNSDGSTLIDLSGFIISYGKSSNNYRQSVDIGSYSSTTIDNLSEDTWCFSVSAYDTSGNKSESSGEVCATIS